MSLEYESRVCTYVFFSIPSEMNGNAILYSYKAKPH